KIALNPATMANGNPSRLFRDNDCHGVRFFGDPQGSPMTQTEAAIQSFPLAYRKNAGRSRDPTVSNDDSAVMQRRFRMENAKDQLDGKIGIERYPRFFIHPD